jgi:hypothetical protein
MWSLFVLRKLRKVLKRLARIEAKLDAVLSGDAAQMAAAAAHLKTGRDALAATIAATPVPPTT